MKIFLEQEVATPDIVDKDSRTPLSSVEEGGYFRVAEILQDQPSPGQDIVMTSLASRIVLRLTSVKQQEGAVKRQLEDERFVPHLADISSLKDAPLP